MKTVTEEGPIKEVWAANLEDEFTQICKVVQKYPFVALDTEFPGVVARPIRKFKSPFDYQYQLIRCNVDLLKIIQLGLTFFNKAGEKPEGICTWQFNFKFNLSEDMYAEDSVELLRNSGIQFDRHEREGIDTMEFAAMLLVSGTVLLDDVKWLSFHSGYDFGYMLRLLTNTNLPEDESDFFMTLNIYFPKIYDIKYLMKYCKNLKGGLQELADTLDVKRIGPQHQAGSDSLLTGLTYFAMSEMYFENQLDDERYMGSLYGLGVNLVGVQSTESPAKTESGSCKTLHAGIANFRHAGC